MSGGYVRLLLCETNADSCPKKREITWFLRAVTLTAVTLAAVTLALMLIIFEIFTQNFDSTFDSTKARQKPDWRARCARPVLLMRAFVESNFESFFA